MRSGTASLEGEFGVDLGPAVTLLPDQRIVSQQHIVEEHLVEVGVAGEIADRSNRHAGKRQVDDELRKPFLPVRRFSGGPNQGDHVLAVMCVGRPDLPAVQAPAFRALGRPRADARQVRAGIGLAHADAEEGLRGADLGQVEAALRLGAELVDQRPALAIRDPVGGDRRARGQQFLHQDEAREGVQAGASVLLGKRDAHPAALSQFPAEAGIESHPGPRAHLGRRRLPRRAQEFANLLAERLRRLRQGGIAECREQLAHGMLTCLSCSRRWPTGAGP